MVFLRKYEVFNSDSYDHRDFFDELIPGWYGLKTGVFSLPPVLVVPNCIYSSNLTGDLIKMKSEIFKLRNGRMGSFLSCLPAVLGNYPSFPVKSKKCLLLVLTG